MSIKIFLHNQGPLYPGTLLQGKVSCNFNSTTDVRSIKIRFYGKEHTEWRGSGKNNPRYFGDHYFFQMETKLHEPEGSRMAVGSYTYPFTFLLPPNLPSTFDFPYGYIRYSLKAIIDIPLAVDPRDRLDLEVISVFDIASLPANIRMPFQATDEAFMGCCWCYNSDPVKMTAQINKLVFLPGETIKINMKLENMSGDNVETVIVKLIRCFVAHSETPRHDTRFINEDILQRTLSGVGAHGEQTYEVNLQIPREIAVPSMVECQLLETIYRIDVKGTTSGFNRDLDMVIAELKMGHIDSATSNLATSSTSSSAYPYPSQETSQSRGYPYPSAPSNGSKKAPLGFENLDINPSAPPPRYEDVLD